MDQSNFIVIIEDVILKILKKKTAVQIQQKAFHMFRPQFSLQTAVHPYSFICLFFNLQSQSSEI